MSEQANKVELDVVDMFEDTQEICCALEYLSVKYLMKPGDDYYIQEAKESLLGMQTWLRKMQKELKKQ